MAVPTLEVVQAPDGERAGVAPRGLLREPMQLVTVLAAASALVLSAGPLKDLDVYWHILIGRIILHTGHITGDGAAWSFGPVHRNWTSSEWLGETGLAALYDWGGAAALIAARELLTVALLAVLARTLLPNRPPRHAALVFTAVAVPLGSVVQERPELIGYLLLAALAPTFARLVRDASAPVRPLPIAVATFLCANIHGLWVCVPGLFAVLAAGSLLETGWSSPVKRLIGYAGITAVAGSISPLGPRGLWLPVVMHFATAGIAEWQPVNIAFPQGWGLLTLLAVLAVGWARSRGSATRTEISYAVALAVFGLSALRNAVPASLLLAPLVLDRMSLAFRSRPVATGTRERLLLTAVAVILSLGGLCYLIVSEVVNPGLPGWVPQKIAASLASDRSTQRVLNDYNVSGALLLLGGPHITVGIDGRADAYPASYRSAYQSAFDLSGDWRGLISRLDPTSAVLAAHAPLTYGLETLGWRVRMRDGPWLLLVPPPRSSPGVSAGK